ncbi:MAG TPA: dephospho-CoA kinase [Cellvibrionaceae bacterium]
MTKQRLIIGLTGGIGSGKTEVSNRFAQYGIVIIDADTVARACVVPGSKALHQIKNHFGDGIITENGELNRALLRTIIFNNPAEKHWTEQLLHPMIRQAIIQALKESRSVYSILVSPLLLETDQHQLTHRVLVVDSLPEIQIQRASLRDKLPEENIKSIMATQLSRQERLQQADDIIINDGDFSHLDSNVAKLHQKYLNLAEKLNHE